jgi:hypothetical protein
MERPEDHNRASPRACWHTFCRSRPERAQRRYEATRSRLASNYATPPRSRRRLGRPSVAKGFQLRTWRGGPQKGEPKLPPTGKTLVDRDLMRIDWPANIPRLFFTEAGTAARRRMMADRRFADPVKFAHVWRWCCDHPFSTRKSANGTTGVVHNAMLHRGRL